MSTYVDLAYAKTTEGHYDLVVDEGARDLATTDGLDSALMVSLFSDRRAYEDEVADPMKRRGWIGDLVARDPNDRHGSGLWIVTEQHRLEPQTEIAVRIEAEAAVDWMREEGLITARAARVGVDRATRRVSLLLSLEYPDGSTAQKAYALASNTIQRALVSAG